MAKKKSTAQLQKRITMLRGELDFEKMNNESLRAELSAVRRAHEELKAKYEPMECPQDQIHLTVADVLYSAQVLHSDKPNLVELRLWPAGNRAVLEFKTNKVFAARLAAVLNFAVRVK